MEHYKKTSITDEPRGPEQIDNFNISQYEDGLCKFLAGADTPLTIALQGEWGSGKTSLMYSIRNKLCEESGAKFKSIWINTWEYALMSEPQTTLSHIISQITSQISRNFSENENAVKKVKEGLRKFFKVATKTTVAAISGGDSSPADELWSDSEESSLGELRKALEEMIITYKRNHQDCQGLIFFIDDLDRISPTSAVQLMELMKNLFTLKHCIFVLAIDYEVVVKGLKPKFGERSEENEHEFRSFFDKIIQVPFSMPVKQYEVNDFIFKSLDEIGYFTDYTEIAKYKDDIEEIVRLSVGTNPRSIKRLINSTSLINCVYGTKKEINSPKNRFLNFAFIALQSVYPKFYQLLHDEPDFTSWSDEKFLLEHHVAEWNENDNNQLEKKIHKFADEPWEMAIKKLCDKSVFLQRNFLEISHLFNIIRKYVSTRGEDGKEVINTNLISSIIKLSQTTNTQIETKPSREFTTNSVINTIYAKLKTSVNSLTKKSIASGSGEFEVGNRNPFEVRISLSLKQIGTYMDLFIQAPWLKEVSEKSIKSAIKPDGNQVSLDGVICDASNGMPNINVVLKTDDMLNFTSPDCINAMSKLFKELQRMKS